VDTRKIYRYYPATTENILQSIQWAKENYDRYDGEVSFLWNDYVLAEFDRRNKEVAQWREAWAKVWADIGNQFSFDYETAEEIDLAPEMPEVMFKDREGVEEEKISDRQRNLFMLSYL